MFTNRIQRNSERTTENKVEFFLKDKEVDKTEKVEDIFLCDVVSKKETSIAPLTHRPSVLSRAHARLEKQETVTSLDITSPHHNDELNEESEFSDDDEEIELQQNGALKPIDEDNYFGHSNNKSKASKDESAKSSRSNSLAETSPSKKEMNKIQSLKSFITRQKSKDLGKKPYTPALSKESEANSQSTTTYYIFEDEGDVL